MQVPTYAGYDWHAVALILVSWYAAMAGYAASASFRPATAAALLLGSAFCALLLLSGAVAPTLRTMYSSSRFFYGLSGEPHSPPHHHSSFLCILLIAIHFHIVNSIRQFLSNTTAPGQLLHCLFFLLSTDTGHHVCQRLLLSAFLSKALPLLG